MTDTRQSTGYHIQLLASLRPLDAEPCGEAQSQLRSLDHRYGHNKCCA